MDFSRKELEGKTVSELHKLCKVHGIKGHWKLNKKSLAALLLSQEYGEDTDTDPTPVPPQKKSRGGGDVQSLSQVAQTENPSFQKGTEENSTEPNMEIEKGDLDPVIRQIKTLQEEVNALRGQGEKDRVVAKAKKATGHLKDLTVILLALFSFLVAGLSYWHSYKTDAQDATVKADKLLAEAWDLMGGEEGSGTITEFISDRKRLEMARRKIDQAIKIKPNYAIAYRILGKCYGAKYNWEKAIIQFTKAIKLDPKHSETFIHLGDAYMALNEVRKALYEYGEAIRIKPQNVEAINKRGIAFHAVGLFRRALADYNEAIRINPQDARGFSNRGLTYEAMGDVPEAFANYQKAIRLKPTYAQAFYNRGNLYNHFLKRIDLALRDYDEAIRLKPTYAEAFHIRGKSYRLMGKTKKAIEDFEEYLRLNEHKPEEQQRVNRTKKWIEEMRRGLNTQ